MRKPASVCNAQTGEKKMRKVKEEETEAVGRGIREGRQRNNAPNKTGSRGAGVQKVGHMTRRTGLPNGVQGAGTNDDQLREGWRPTWPPSRRRQDSTPHASTLTHSTAKTGATENRRVSFPIMAFFCLQTSVRVQGSCVSSALSAVLDAVFTITQSP